MIDVIFEIGGKRLDVKNISDPLQKTVLSEAEKSIRNTLGNVTCPEHGKEPTVLVSGPSLDKLAFEVKGCCEKVINAVKSQLASG